MDDARRYTIGELSDLAGTTRRAIHYYVQSGRLPRPHGSGRGAYYDDEHLKRLKELKSVATLATAPAANSGLSALGAGARAAEAQTLTRIPIGAGAWLDIAHGASQPEPATINRLAQAVRQILGGLSRGEPPAATPVSEPHVHPKQREPSTAETHPPKPPKPAAATFSATLAPPPRRRRLSVVNRVGTVFLIPNGRGEGADLRLGPREKVPIDTVTLAVQRAIDRGQLELVEE